VEERGRARRVTQSVLGEPPLPTPSGEVTAPTELMTTPIELPSADTPTILTSSRGPSDTELRKRQRAWQRERALHDASMTAEPSPDPGSR
jgi:hypothetical protein